MFKLLAVFAAAMVLAYISEINTRAIIASGRHYSAGNDWALVALIMILSLFAGLRTNYNDTANYIGSFRSASTLAAFVGKAENLNPLKNPLFLFYQSFLRTITDNPQIFVFSLALLDQILLIRFFKRYSDNFLFSIFLYFTLGTFVFSLAAMKQITAMAVLTLCFPYLEKKQWARYYLVVLAAMLIHTYAMAFAVLPLFRTKPWGLFTFLFIAVVGVVMVNFEVTITEFMEQANDLGKTLADYEVFSDAGINIFRLGVYAVPPLISLVFRRWVLREASGMDHVFIHMSIISLAFMSLGTQAGANMFGRMANYFELATICCLPRMLKKTFDERSYRFVMRLACVCYLGFFVYANAIHGNFDGEYRSVSLFKFVASLF